HAQSVGHADTQMDTKCRWRHQPAIESRPRDGVLTIEDSSPDAGGRSSALNNSHAILPYRHPSQAHTPSLLVSLLSSVPLLSGNAVLPRCPLLLLRDIFAVHKRRWTPSTRITP